MNPTETIVTHEGVVRTEAADSCVRPAFHKNLPSTAASNEIPRWQSAVDFYVFVDSPSLLFERGRFGYVPPNISVGPTCLAVTSPKVTYDLPLCSGKSRDLYQSGVRYHRST